MSGHSFDADHQVALERALQSRGFTSRAWCPAPCATARSGEAPAVELRWSTGAVQLFNADQLTPRGAAAAVSTEGADAAAAAESRESAESEAVAISYHRWSLGNVTGAEWERTW
jgi:hypothetical protein